jgi:acyl-[acyl-carrier-protein]-phospholipid O-acyltransferase/long-chain-fatty-acid--[acyl-carrier-protein] ligase
VTDYIQAATYSVRRNTDALFRLSDESRKHTVASGASSSELLPLAFIRACKQAKRRSKVADSSGADLTGGSLLMRALILRRLLRRHAIADDERFVGVFLPPTVAGVVTNMAMTLDRRVVVNLNYTVGSDVLNQCIARCGIKHVLTSRKFMEKMGFELDAEVVCLEDLRDKVTLLDKLTSAWSAFCAPADSLIRSLGLDQLKADDLLTVIFTSGSEDTPKGVMLSYGNVGHNVDAVQDAIHLSSDDVMVGVLPFFHSFGYTVTMWVVVTLQAKGIYHFSPLEAKQIGKLSQKHRATILVGTPTFLRNYLRRCSPEEFASLDVVIAGAEKLPSSLADAFEERFGVRPSEGYGATELSPLVSVNIPAGRVLEKSVSMSKEGTVGKAVLGVAAKTVDLETGEDLPRGQRGMLLVKGDNVMQGYLDDPEKTAKVVRDGWYVTGDVAVIDEDGFIEITGRESRFSKIGGEMVPHIQIENVIAGILDADEDEGLLAAVTAVPDERKGERLIVVHKPLQVEPSRICERLTAEGLPNLYVPSPDSFCEVDELPILGSGKLDLKGVRRIALERFGPAED